MFNPAIFLPFKVNNSMQSLVILDCKILNNINMSDKKGKEAIKKEKQSLSEQAINHRETDGVNVNKQVKQRQEKHQPRDNA